MSVSVKLDKFRLLCRGLAVVLAGSVTATASAQVGPPPSIILQPADQTTVSGGTAAFAVGVSSVTLVTYQWRFNAVNISGATSSAYAITNVQYTNGGFYSVALTNAAGWAISSNAALTVLNTPLRFTSALWETNGFRGRLEGPIGANYVLSITTNLINWMPISTNLAVTGSVDFSDPDSTNFPRRFYRGSLQ